MCMNTYGSFYCVCPRGYSAKTSQFPCEGKGDAIQLEATKDVGRVGVGEVADDIYL